MGPPLGLPQRNISRWESVASVASQSGAAKKAGGAGAVIYFFGHDKILRLPFNRSIKIKFRLILSI